MSKPIEVGPRHPSRAIFIATVVIAAVVGVVTGRVGAFMLALIGCATVLCAGYALIRRLLGWRPLDFDYLTNFLGILHP